MYMKLIEGVLLDKRGRWWVVSDLQLVLGVLMSTVCRNHATV